jgi:hypothetical protein
MALVAVDDDVAVFAGNVQHVSLLACFTDRREKTAPVWVSLRV